MPRFHLLGEGNQVGVGFKPAVFVDPFDDVVGLKPWAFLLAKFFQARDDLSGSHWCAPSMGPVSFKRVSAIPRAGQPREPLNLPAFERACPDVSMRLRSRSLARLVSFR